MKSKSGCRRTAAGAMLVGMLAASAGAQNLVPVSIGADVIVGDLPAASNYTPNTTSGSPDIGFEAYAIGTTSCNKGDVNFNWFSGSDNRHPVIGQNLFRLSNGRFEQIGQSWLKHGFTALQGTECANDDGFTQYSCSRNPSGQKLGVGCSDPYSSGLNGSQGGLGPKWQVNASQGLFPGSHATPLSSSDPGGGETPGRLRVRVADLVAGASYVVEGQYVASDDAATNHKNNNASYRTCTIGSSPAYTMTLSSSTVREQPAIYAWQALDPTVTITTVDLAGDGMYLLGCKTTNNAGTWTYEYALQNLNSHRCAWFFRVPKPAGGAPGNYGFHDVEYWGFGVATGEPNAVNPANPNSDDWGQSTSGSQISWTGPTYSGTPPVYTLNASDPLRLDNFTPGTGNDHAANVLRWGTLFNFRFTTTHAPAAGRVEVGLWRPGSRTSFTMNIPTPGGAVIGTEPTGTCCTGTACSITTQAGCAGMFQMVDGTCSPNPCVEPARGACCELISGAQVCRFSSQDNCIGTQGGTSTAQYLGDGTTCQGNPCVTFGACCTGTSCTSTTQATCPGGSSFLGAGTSCSPNPCSGACCTGTVCSITTASGCTGPFTPSGTCSPNPCQVACCDLSGGCTVTTPTGCSGNPRQPGSTCSPNPCVGPPNDACANAIAICPGESIVGTTTNAVDDGNALCANSASTPDVWYFYVPAANGDIQADLCTATYDCALSVWTGDCPGNTQVACDDDACGSLHSLLNFSATAGTRYLIRVSGYNGNTGNFTLTLTAINSTNPGCDNAPAMGSCCAANGDCSVTVAAGCTDPWTSGQACTPNPCPQPTGSCCDSGNCSVTTNAACTGAWTLAGTCTPNACPPANDDCANRAGIGLGATPYDTTYATTDGPSHTGCNFFSDSNVNKDIWYNHPATFTGTLDISTCGSLYDTKIAVYDGYGCDNLDARLLACNDDNPTAPPAGCGSADNLRSFLTINVFAGTSYTIRVGGYGGNGGVGTLTLTAHPLPSGSCCFGDGTCTETLAVGCQAIWTSGAVCNPNPCPQPTGACCCGSNCSQTTAAACTGPNRSFTGVGMTCTPYSSTVPCCRGDYNKSNSIGVQDIFDFLAGYFSGDSCADANDSGGPHSPQDIFDFLAAYFSGCL